MKCSICTCDFNDEEEGGGIVGTLGILPIALCPTCLSGMMDLFEQMVCGTCEYNPNDEDDEL